MTLDSATDGEVIYEWNPSVECPMCGKPVKAQSHTFPDIKRSKPFYTYECTSCDNEGMWIRLARMYGIK